MIIPNIAFLLIATASAKEAKIVSLDEHQIYPLMLALGKTTLLRFPEKPQRLIIGNKNYFNIESNDTDIALQPLAKVETNLFVYTSDQTFSFNLKVCENCSSDDFVKVQKKIIEVALPREAQKPRFKEMSLNVIQSFNDFELKITTIKTQDRTLLIDYILTPKNKVIIKVEDLKLGAQGLNSQSVFQALENGNYHGRTYIPNKPKNNFSMTAVYKNQKRIFNIPRRYLF